MGTPGEAFNFYASSEYRDAVITFGKLLEINNDRKKLQKHLVKNALLQCINVENENSIVIILTSGLGLNGIVSSSVGEQYNKPIVTFIKDGNTMSGSARGINKHFNLYQAFKNMNELDPTVFVKFGGHKGAAGCEIYSDKVNIFKRLFNDEAKRQLEGTTQTKVYEVVGSLPDESINETLIPEIKTLAPFGMSFNKVYFVGAFTLHKVMYIGRNSEHVSLKFTLADGSRVESFIFNADDKFDHDLLVVGNKLKVVYRPTLNTFKGNIEFRLEIVYLTKF
jgi:single-stranded-DNA-specific exonuclease